MIILINLALILLAGILYRLGGAGDVGDGYDFLRKRNMRLVGVSLVTAVLLLPAITVSIISFIGLFFTIGLSVGVLSLGYGGKGEPKNEQSFLYRVLGERVFFGVGFLFGLALLPFGIGEYVIGNVGAIKGVGERMVILTVLIPAIHHFRRPILGLDSAQVEEFSRGIAITATLLIF